MKDLNSQFRPTIWEGVVGQTNIIELLKKQAKNRTGLANAYIFSGKSGIGKTTLARLFFKTLNCKSPTENGNPCEECVPCKNFTYELVEINASNTNSIDDMRELIADMNYVTSGKYKGVLLDECHMLSKAAWNCLLKPLEDGSERIFWLFCTTELAKVPKTIQTRCQIFKLSPLTWTHIHDRLNNIVDELKISISNEELWSIARNSNNNMRQAIHLLEQYSVVGDLKKIITDEVDVNFLSALQHGDLKVIWNTFVKGSTDTRYADIDVFFNKLKFDVSSTLLVKLGVTTQVNKYALEQYKKAADMISEDKLATMLNIILDIEEKISGVWDYNSMFLLGLCKYRNIFNLPGAKTEVSSGTISRKV